MSTQIIRFKNLPVITTAQLSAFYGADTKNIQNNFLRNTNRFVEGKHFFKLDGEALRTFKKSLTLSKMVSRNARSLILWTERGAARHAKMLDTEHAWEVFEQLEDSYFNKVIQPKALAQPIKQLDLQTHYVTKQQHEALAVRYHGMFRKYDQMIDQLRETISSMENKCRSYDASLQSSAVAIADVASCLNVSEAMIENLLQVECVIEVRKPYVTGLKKLITLTARGEALDLVILESRVVGNQVVDQLLLTENGIEFVKARLN